MLDTAYSQTGYTAHCFEIGDQISNVCNIFDVYISYIHMHVWSNLL